MVSVVSVAVGSLEGCEVVWWVRICWCAVDLGWYRKHTWQCCIVQAIHSCMGVSRIVTEGLVTAASTRTGSNNVMVVIVHWVGKRWLLNSESWVVDVSSNFSCAVFVVVGLSRASTTMVLLQWLIVFFSGACCWHHASNKK